MADRGFPSGIYLPSREIVYDDVLNAEILDVLKLDPVRYRNVFVNGATKKHGDYRYLYDYIMRCTEHMPEDRFKLAFRIFWVLNKWQDFPRCTICGKRLILDNENLGFRLRLNPDGSLFYKWPRACCPVHAQIDETARQNYIDTCMDRYGCINTFQVPEFKEKKLDSFEKNYGVRITAPAQVPEVLAKMQATCIRNYGKPNPYQVKEFQDRWRREYFEKTGYENPNQNPAIREASEARQMAERGYTHIQMRNKAPGYEKNILNSEYDEPLFSLEEFVRTDNHVVPMRFKCRKCGKEFESIHVRRHARCPECWPEDWIGKELGGSISSLNHRMYMILDAAGIGYRRELTLRFREGEKSDGKFNRRYDINIGDVLIELNGDYWHANPNTWTDGHAGLKPDDVIKFRSGEYTAAEIWAYDTEKRKLAESYGYRVFYLWESEMESMTNEEVLEWVMEKISS